MPFEVRKDNEKFCVFNTDTDESKGCSDTKAQAVAHLKSLYSSEAEMAAEDVLAALDEDESLSGENYVFSDGMEEFQWEGPIAFEEVTTGDNRSFNTDSIQWEPDTLPWAFRWQKASGQGHAGSVPVGRVDKIERRDDKSIYGFGVVIPGLNEEAAEYLRILQTNCGGGVSVDGDSATFTVLEQEEGQPRVEFSSMRLRALSAVDVPAFNGARIHLVGSKTEPLETEALEASANTTDLIDFVEYFDLKEEDMEEFYALTESIEDITDAWREVTQAAELSGDTVDLDSIRDRLKGQASVEVEEVSNDDIDIREELANKRKKAKTKKYGWHFDSSLIASAIPTLPSTMAFVDPEFDGPTGLTVTKDGQVFGHLALFNTCHIGFPGTCVKPPKGSKYQYFHTGQIETAEGDLVETGRLTFKTGHADMNASPRIAADHYDNTGTVAADVRAGEDKFGIWVTGALRPHLSDEDIRAFRCAPLSGDWRRIAGKLELVGALGVNTPGFPIPRVRALVASGETETLFTFLEEDDVEFHPSDYELSLRKDKKASLSVKVGPYFSPYELDLRLDKKVALAAKLDAEPSSIGRMMDEIPNAPTEKELKDRAKNYTKDQLFADLKSVRELLDDPDEEMPEKVRDGLEELYKAFIVVGDKGKKFSNSGFDLGIIEGSGLGFEEWENQLSLSGLGLVEFYNQCHGEDGKFCQGKDGPGRVRDSKAVKGRHPNDSEPNPFKKEHGGTQGRDHAKIEHPGADQQFPRNPGQPGKPGQPGQKGKPGQPQQKGPQVDFKLYEKSRQASKNAIHWGAAATVAYAAVNSPLSGILQGMATASGVALLGSPAILGLIFATGAAYGVKNFVAAKRLKMEYNSQVDRKMKYDKVQQQNAKNTQRVLNS